MSLLDASYALLLPGGRQIGTIVPDCTVAEVHQDALAITDHPVEIGAAISDHAFLLPERLEMRIAYSDSTGGYVGYARERYQEVLALMAKREPFEIYTAKRVYRDMLVEFVTTDTEQKTASAAMIIVRFRRILLAYARGGGRGSGAGGTGGGSGTGSGAGEIAPNTAQANPESTGGWQEIGTTLPYDTGAIVPPGLQVGLTTGLTANTIAFGSALPATNLAITPGGFGPGGPVGNSAF